MRISFFLKTIVLFFVFCVFLSPVKGQVVFVLNEASLLSIKDIDPRLFSEDVEQIIDFGPYLKVNGALVNNTDEDIAITNGNIDFSICFQYRGKIYHPEIMPINPFDYFYYEGTTLPAHAIIEPVSFGMFLFHGTSLDILEKERIGRRGKNIRKGRRLARIANKVLPTISISVQ